MWEPFVSKSPEDEGAEERRNNAEEDARYVGRAIEVERTKARLTQGDLAQLSGVSQPHISSIEKGTLVTEAEHGHADRRSVGRRRQCTPSAISP